MSRKRSTDKDNAQQARTIRGVSFVARPGSPGGLGLWMRVACLPSDANRQGDCLAFLSVLYRHLLAGGLSHDDICWDAVLPEEDTFPVSVGDSVLFAYIRESAYPLVYRWCHKEAAKRGLSFGFDERKKKQKQEGEKEWDIRVEKEKHPPRLYLPQMAHGISQHVTQEEQAQGKEEQRDE